MQARRDISRQRIEHDNNSNTNDDVDHDTRGVRTVYKAPSARNAGGSV